MSTRPTDEQLARLRELGAATLRGSGTARLYRRRDQADRPVDEARRHRLTVDAGSADNLLLHAALRHARPGDILVADAKGFVDAGAWGDVLTAAAQKVRIAGLVINGAVRDADEIIDMKFPVFAKGLSIRGTTKVYKGSIGQPVDIAGTTVNNGDVIVGDRDGLVVIRADEVESALELAEARANKETKLRAQIADGASTVELLGLTTTLSSYFPN